MVVNQLMALLLPGIIYLKAYEKFSKKETKGEESIRKYLTGTMIINMSIYFIVIYILKTPLFIFTNQFTLKYMVLSIMVAVIFAIIERIIKANVEIEMEVELNNDKEN